MPNGSLVLAVTVAGMFALSLPVALAQTHSEVRSTGDVHMTDTMPTMSAATLKVPGATLYYEVRGSGPTLLVIPGGPQDAGVFSDLAQRLADRYRVVTFDPRGNSRSPFDGAPVELDMMVQADDAAALIRAVGNGPAHVFGTSGGAQIGLALAARHPDLVKAVLAHEPPSMMLMDDPSAALAADKVIYDTYRRDGVDAAMGAFFGMNGLEDGPSEEMPAEMEMSPEDAETFGRVSGNFEYWLAHGMMPLGHYRPDVEALRPGQPPIVVAIGEGSAGQPIEAMGQALARELSIKPVAFPGDHMGFEAAPAEFAAAVHRAFTR